jgi:cytochrome P450
MSPFFKLEEFFNPQIQKDFKIVRDFGLQVVKDRKDRVVKGVEGDLISLFLNYKGDDDESLTDEQMVDQVINFLIAGRDTTAQALSWTMYCLSQNPRCVDIMLEEIFRITGDNDIPTYDQVKEMKYTKAVFNETLRLYPSVPRNFKCALKDDVLPDG